MQLLSTTLGTARCFLLVVGTEVGIYSLLYTQLFLPVLSPVSPHVPGRGGWDCSGGSLSEIAVEGRSEGAQALWRGRGGEGMRRQML